VRSFVKIERISTLFLTPSATLHPSRRYIHHDATSIATLQGIVDVVSDVVSNDRDNRDGPAIPVVASADVQA